MLWSFKMKTLLLFNEVWDLVTGTRVRPDPAPAAIVVADAAHANQAAITAATKKIRDLKRHPASLLQPFQIRRSWLSVKFLKIRLRHGQLSAESTP